MANATVHLTTEHEISVEGFTALELKTNYWEFRDSSGVLAVFPSGFVLYIIKNNV